MRSGIVGFALVVGFALARAAAAEPKPLAPRVVAVLGDDALRFDRAVTAVALSADGRVGAVGSGDGVDVFEVPSLRRVRFFPDLIARGRGLALSSDGMLLAASVNGRALARAPGIRSKIPPRARHDVEVWNLIDGKRVAAFEPAIEVRAAAFSPDGRRLAVGGTNLGIELWDLVKARARWRKEAHSANGEILSLAFSPDGSRLLSGANVGIAGGETDEWFDTLRLWNVETAAQIRPIGGGMSVAAFSADGRFFIDAGAGGAAVFRVDADEPFVVLPHFADPKKAVQFVEGASLSADGALAATAGSDGALATWDVAKGREVERVAAHKMMIEAFAASADGRYGLTGSRDGRARLWQLSPLREIATRPGHDGPVRSLVASPDGARLWSAGADGRVLEWTLARPGEIAVETIFDARKPDPTGWAPTALGTFASGGSVVVALDTRRVWATDRLTGRTLWDRQVPEVVYLFPPVVGGSAVAANALILDLESGAQVMTIGGAGEFHALSPDGRLVAVGDDKGALWLADARSGARVRAFAGHGSAQTFVVGQGFVTVPHATVEGGAFRADGAVLVTTGNDHTARFWRVSTGEALGAVALSSTSSPPRAVAFSPDGRRVVVCEEETGLVRVVDGASFREVAVLNLRTDARLMGARPRSVAFSPDDRSVYVGTSRGPIAVIAVP